MSEDIQARFLLRYADFTLDVDLTLPGHGITALFGYSGSGKTTLLRLIAGLEHVPDGRLVVNGETWQNGKLFLPTHQRPLGYVFQEASLFPHLSARGNLEYGMKRAADPLGRTALDHVIELLGIGQLLERKSDQLSGGERQRVAIARALAVKPRLLLMDEPLASLDIKRKLEILPYLERLHDELDIPVLYVSHAPDEVARLADHLVVMEGGHILASGSLGETLARLDLPIRLGEDVGVVVDAVVGERDIVWHLARMDFPGGSLWTRDKGIPVGRKLRVRVLARDVSLSMQHQEQTSIQNHLQGRVDAMTDDEHPGLTLVRVLVGQTALIARLTKRSAAAIGLALEQDVWLQVKSVALLE